MKLCDVKDGQIVKSINRGWRYKRVNNNLMEETEPNKFILFRHSFYCENRFPEFFQLGQVEVEEE